jgi:hypothetical protein
MPAVDTGGAWNVRKQRKAKPRKPKPRRPRKPSAREMNIIRARAVHQGQVAPRPAPRPAPRKPAIPRATVKARERVQRIRGEIERKTPDVQSEAAVERYMQSPEYIARLQAARATRAQRLRKDLLHGYQRESAAEAQRREDERAMHPLLLPRPFADQPRTDAELRRFLNTGERPVRTLTAHDVRSARRAASLAPATKVLEQVSRGGYASAGAARALVRGENVPRAALRGAELKDHYLYGDVLREAGWRPKGGLGKVAESVVGTALDVGLDPTTYLTAGTASVARKAALMSARAAAKPESRRVLAHELATGASRTQARRTARTAGAKAGAAAYEHRIASATARERETVPRVSIGVGRARVGTPVKGAATVRRTAREGRQATARQVERVAPKAVARSRAAGVKSRQLASELNALVRPAGMSAEQFARSRQIARSKRATAEQVARRGQQRAWALRALTRPGEYRLIRDAIEADDLARLKGIAQPIRLSPRVIRGRAAIKRLARDPDRLYLLARHFGNDLTATRERAVTAGVPVGFVGRKPPVAIPEVTADVNVAWEKVLKARTPQQKRAAVAELRRVEREAVAQKTHRRLAQKVAAEREREAKGYVPRIARERIEQRGPLTVEDVVEQPTRHVQGGAKRPRPSRRRTVTEPMTEIEARAAAGDEIAQRYLAAHSTELPLVAQAYHAGMGRGIASAEANRALVAEGRLIVPGHKIELAPGERVYAHEGSDLRELKAHADADELRAIERGEAAGSYVALPRSMVEHVTASNVATPGAVGALWDRVQSRWRQFALGSPSYLMRNLLGDAFAAYGAQDPLRLARNYVRGQRALNEYGRTERAYKWFQSTMEKGGKGTTTTVSGQPIRYRDLALEAEAVGAIRQGRLAEIRDGAGARKPLAQLKVGTSAWSRAVERVEDSARLATYIGARERGLSPERAAALVAKVHFDYGELTRLEKQFRRASGFYTFPTRNLPRMAGLLASRPGKPAAAEKAREEFQKTSGLPADYLEGLDPFEARQMGLPLKLGDKVFTVSAGQPFVDLNDLTPGNLVYRELGLVTPLAKLPVELLLNSSAFYRDTIEDPKAPRTPVPAPVARLADRSPELRKRLKIKRIMVDGKLVWGWHKKLDYGIRQVMPGLFGAAYRVSQKPSARGFGPGGELLGSLTGVRFKPYTAEQATNNRLYTRLRALEAHRSELNQAGIYAANATPEWRRVSAEIRALQARLDRARVPAPRTGGLVRVPTPRLRGSPGPGLVRVPARRLVK